MLKQSLNYILYIVLFFILVLPGIWLGFGITKITCGIFSDFIFCDSEIYNGNNNYMFYFSIVGTLLLWIIAGYIISQQKKN